MLLNFSRYFAENLKMPKSFQRAITLINIDKLFKSFQAMYSSFLISKKVSRPYRQDFVNFFSKVASPKRKLRQEKNTGSYFLTVNPYRKFLNYRMHSSWNKICIKEHDKEAQARMQRQMDGQPRSNICPLIFFEVEGIMTVFATNCCFYG